MKRFSLGVGVVVAGLALGAAPAFAQRPSESGSHTGASDHAVDRGSAGGGGTASSGSTSVATGSGGVSSSSPSAGVAASPSVSRADFALRESAPQHRAGSGGGQHTASSGSRGGQHTASSGDHASPRGESATPRSAGRTSENASRPSESTEPRAVPSWARPRGDRPATDTAVERTTPRRGGSTGGYYYDPYYGGYYSGGYYGNYYPYGTFGYWAPYAYGGFYDPFYYDPWDFSPGFFGYGMSMGLGGYPYVDPMYGGVPYAYGTGGGSYAQGHYASTEQGNLKLKVKPRAAKVYVDGYYVGVVDEFDGAFQKLPLNAGRHHVKVEAEGYETAEFDVTIVPEQTVTFKGQLKKMQ